MFKKKNKNNLYNMDLLFLLTIGDKVKSNTRNRLKLIRDFELLIDYEEKDNYYNNFILSFLIISIVIAYFFLLLLFD